MSNSQILWESSASASGKAQLATNGAKLAAAAAAQKHSTQSAAGRIDGGSYIAAALDTPDSDNSQVKNYVRIVIGLFGGIPFIVHLLFAIGVALCMKRGGRRVVRAEVCKGAIHALDYDSEDKRYSD
ncbi:hypothetical protein B0H11DRAFT_2215695 [Mycena galericulata]|nr:hypothetical protein B0H11DRAFT_1913529 [Mycena galericulata]KAJ7510959.1 hypothetical protein B0H11DRAFT_2215695 [Mycena galericulata]